MKCLLKEQTRMSNCYRKQRAKHDFLESHSSLRLLLGTQLERLTSLQYQLVLMLAYRALQSQHYLLRHLGLLLEHRLCLTTIPRLLAIVAALALGE